MNSNETICINTAAFYALLDQVIERVDEKYEQSKEPKWIASDEVMKMLNISSRTTLQTIKDSGDVRVSIMSKKVVLYDRQSVLAYIEKHSKRK